MKKRASLLARLERLEKRQLAQPLRRRIIFEIAGADAGDIVGITDSKIHILRQIGETVDAFERRAFEATGSRTLFCVYRTPGASSERADAEGWHNPALEA